MVQMVTGGKPRVGVDLAKKLWRLAEECDASVDSKFVEIESLYGHPCPLGKSAVVDSKEFRKLYSLGKIDVLEDCLIIHKKLLADKLAGKPKDTLSVLDGSGTSLILICVSQNICWHN